MVLNERAPGPDKVHTGMISGFEGWPNNGRAPAAAVWDELRARFGWLVAQFTDRADLEALVARLLHIPLPAHTPLITREAASCSLYLVARGALNVTVTHAGPLAAAGDGPAGVPARDRRSFAPCAGMLSPDAGNGAVTLGHIREGGWIGESGLLNLEPVGYSVTVACDSWLLVLTASQFARLRRERVSAASTLLRIFSLEIADRFRTYRQTMAGQAGGRAARGSSAHANLALLAVLLGITKG